MQWFIRRVVKLVMRSRRRDWWDHLEERAYRNEFGSRILFMRQGLF